MSKSIEAEILGWDPVTGIPNEYTNSGLRAGLTVDEMRMQGRFPPTESIRSKLKVMRREQIFCEGQFAASKISQTNTYLRERFIPDGRAGYKVAAGLQLKEDEKGTKSVYSYYTRGSELSNRFGLNIDEAQGNFLLHGANHNGWTYSLSYRLADGGIISAALSIPHPNSPEWQPLRVEYPKEDEAPFLPFQERGEIQGFIGSIPVGMSYWKHLDIDQTLSRLVPIDTRENPLTTPLSFAADKWAHTDNMDEWGIEIS
ncbi:MAG: hypothetical protein KA477_01255 [Candidatus Levybacteria bacterium]|nr:hypothetical protein [Candidatus Levybacteria bacterium]